MLTNIGNTLLYTGAACVGLYLLWQLAERLDHYMIRRRRTKIRKKSGGDSICRWGVNAAGELGHVRCKRTPDDYET